MSSAGATPLATTLARYMRDRGMSLQRLADASGVLKGTIHHWLNDPVQRPYGLDSMLKVARALRLSRAQVERLLRAAHHPPLEQLQRAGKLGRHRTLLRAVGKEAP